MRGTRQRLTTCVLVCGLAGCGHPATGAECEAIFDRIVELELSAQNVKGAELEHKRAETIKAYGNKTDAVQACVGKHITDKAMACVREAKTAEEITERCLQ